MMAEQDSLATAIARIQALHDRLQEHITEYKVDQNYARDYRHDTNGVLQRLGQEIDHDQMAGQVRGQMLEKMAVTVDNVSKRLEGLEQQRIAQEGSLSVIRWLWAGIGGILMLGVDVFIRKWLEK